MKATGIVRRLDDLGRLVIPKEMRRQYRLKEGDSIEFFTEDDKIIITKHNVFSRSMEEIEYMCEILMKLGESTVLFLHEEWLDKHQISVSEGFLKHANVHRNIRFSEERVYADSAVRYQGFLFPIIVFGDWYGA
ncbi:MAG: AbrB/MazE/SpoVT family DNA-binding domain-containing protein, partial [Merdibacter sp.]|nr:AbrB/MazE/SpoVT family DNA-binding domain-containing protein [Merdibacter sp.]